MPKLTVSTLFKNDKEYFADEEYLSSSGLSNFVSFDAFGNPVYNFVEFLNPTRPNSSAMNIGTYCDQVLTDGKNIDDLIMKKMSVAELEEECEMNNIDVAAERKALWLKGKATMAQLRSLLENNGMKFSKEVAPAIYSACKTILDRADNFQYDSNTSFAQYIAECQTQVILVNEDLGIKGKPDFYNPIRNRITDLKTCMNIDRLKKELIYKNEINPFHRYTRQLAIYQRLAYFDIGIFPECELAIIDHKGHHMILRVWQEALDIAWEQVDRDIEVLKTYGSKEQKDYAVHVTATRKDPGTVVQVLLDEEEIEEEEQLM